MNLAPSSSSIPVIMKSPELVCVTFFALNLNLSKSVPTGALLISVYIQAKSPSLL